jgi:hypothetical protein
MQDSSDIFQMANRRMAVGQIICGEALLQTTMRRTGHVANATTQVPTPAKTTVHSRRTLNDPD